MEKKSIGKFLEKKRSWHKVIGYLRKRLHKSYPWHYVYEFDEGEIRIKIVPILDVVHKGRKRAENGEQVAGGRVGRRHHKRKKS